MVRRAPRPLYPPAGAAPASSDSLAGAPLRSPCCPTCGALLAPEAALAALPPGLVGLYSELRRAGARGITTRRLADRLWALDPNGGPDDAEKAVRARVARLNSILARHGLRVVTTPATGPNAVRRLESYDGQETTGHRPGARANV